MTTWARYPSRTLRSLGGLFAAALLFGTCVGSANTGMESGDPLPDPLPDTITTKGIAVFTGFRIRPDGRVVFIEEGQPKDSIAVPIAPEIVRRYIVRLEPIPPADLRRLIDPKTRLLDYHQPEFARGRQGNPLLSPDNDDYGPYYVYTPPLEAKQITVSNSCTYSGQDPDLKRLIAGHRVSVGAMAWTRACKGAEKDCGYLQKHLDNILYAWTWPEDLVHETKVKVYFYSTDPKTGKEMVASAPRVPLPPEFKRPHPLPASEYRNIRCVRDSY